MNRPAVFLDRDGVISRERGHVLRPSQLKMLPGAAAAVARICGKGWRVFLFTNQSGVGRGLLSVQELHAIHECLQRRLARSGGRLDAVYACPHHPDEHCACRKPQPGLLLRAAREHDLTLRDCYVVGDTERDLLAARAAGCKGVLVLTGHTRFACEVPPGLATRVFSNLPQFAAWLPPARDAAPTELTNQVRSCAGAGNGACGGRE